MKKQFLLMLSVVGSLAGCSAPIVTQTTAFVNAGTTITKTVEAAQQNNLSQENVLRKSLLAANYVVKERTENQQVIRYYTQGAGQCAIDGNIYLRYVYTPDRPAENFLKDKRTLELLKTSLQARNQPFDSTLANSCTALMRCEENPMQDGCNTACYKDVERGCIDAIALMVAKNKDPTAAQALRPVAMTLGLHSYPLLVPIEAQASLDVLAAFTNYLHILQAATTPQPTGADKFFGKIGGDPTKSLSDNASKLAANVISMRTKYKSAADKLPFLPKPGGVSDANLTKQLGALGQLFNVLNEIAKTETSAREIKDILAESVNAKGEKATGAGTQARYLYIDEYIKVIGDELAAELDQTIVMQDLAMRGMRNIYATRYQQTNSTVTRLESINALDDYPPVTFADYGAEQENVRKQLPDTIKALTTAHDRLVEMIFNPTAQDKQKAFFSGIEHLKDVVQALAGAISAFK